MTDFELSHFAINSTTSALASASTLASATRALERYFVNVVNPSERFAPSRILKSGNRTIVFWSDGTKTVVKRAEGEPDNDYAAFTAALGIKIFGSNSALRRMIKKSVKVQEKKEKKN